MPGEFTGATAAEATTAELPAMPAEAPAIEAGAGEFAAPEPAADGFDLEAQSDFTSETVMSEGPAEGLDALQPEPRADGWDGAVDMHDGASDAAGADAPDHLQPEPRADGWDGAAEAGHEPPDSAGEGPSDVEPSDPGTRESGEDTALSDRGEGTEAGASEREAAPDDADRGLERDDAGSERVREPASERETGADDAAGRGDGRGGRDDRTFTAEEGRPAYDMRAELLKFEDRLMKSVFRDPKRDA